MRYGYQRLGHPVLSRVLTTEHFRLLVRKVKSPAASEGGNKLLPTYWTGSMISSTPHSTIRHTRIWFIVRAISSLETKAKYLRLANYINTLLQWLSCCVLYRSSHCYGECPCPPGSTYHNRISCYYTLDWTQIFSTHTLYYLDSGWTCLLKWWNSQILYDVRIMLGAAAINTLWG
jgi:hypothetical protein